MTMNIKLTLTVLLIPVLNFSCRDGKIDARGKASALTNDSITQVLSPGADGSWEVSTGSFAGFKLEYYKGAFDKDLTVQVKLIGTPPKAFSIKADQTLSLPITLTLPNVLIPSTTTSLAAIDLSQVGLTMIEDDTGNVVTLGLQATAKSRGQIQTVIKKFGIISVTSANSPANASDIAELKEQLEELKNSNSSSGGIAAASTFFITSPLSPVATSSSTIVWQSSTNAVTYTLTLASDVACTTAAQTFVGLTTTSKVLTGLTSNGRTFNAFSTTIIAL